MWLVCLVDDSHEMSRLVFSEKIKLIVVCCSCDGCFKGLTDYVSDYTRTCYVFLSVFLLYLFYFQGNCYYIFAYHSCCVCAVKVYLTYICAVIISSQGLHLLAQFTLPFSVTSYWPRHAKMYFLAYADSEGPDQPAHLRSLLRTFAVRKQSHWRANARMRLCACAGWCESAHFARARRHFFAWRGPFIIYLS